MVAKLELNYLIFVVSVLLVFFYEFWSDISLKKFDNLNS